MNGRRDRPTRLSRLRPLPILALTAALLGVSLPCSAQNACDALSCAEADNYFNSQWDGNLIHFSASLSIHLGANATVYDEVFILSLYDPQTKKVIHPKRGTDSGLMPIFGRDVSSVNKDLNLIWLDGSISFMLMDCCYANNYPFDRYYAKYVHIPVITVSGGNASSVVGQPILYYSPHNGGGPAPVRW